MSDLGMLLFQKLHEYETQDELTDFLLEAFSHYEYYDYEKSLTENIKTLIGLHMSDALEEYKNQMINTNADFYGKETFRLGDIKIDTRRKS